MKLAPCLLVLALLASSAAAARTLTDAPDAVSITPATASKVFLVDPADQSFDVPTTIHIPPGVPVGDVVFLSDTTGSMGSYINNVKGNIVSIMNSVKTSIPDVQFGLAAYKDQGDTPYTYEMTTALTNNTAAIQAGVNTWIAGGGGDEPEAQLYALQCLAQGACGPPVGFRTNAVRILVWFGDAPGHDTSGGASLTSATNALIAAKIQVIAINLNRLDLFGQATHITGLTHGLYTSNTDPNTLSAAIVAAIKALSRPVTVSTVCDTTLTATYTPSSWTVEGSDTSADLPTTAHVTLLGGSTAGVYTCVTSVLINGVVVDGVTQTITVRANRKPDCAAAQLVLERALWPSDHTMVKGTVVVTDPDGDAVTVTITSITQSEASKAPGTGNFCPDATLSPLTLRREKAGPNIKGRIYKVNFSAKDEYDASCTGTVSTCVPHDQGQGNGVGCDFDQAVTFSPACPA